MAEGFYQLYAHEYYNCLPWDFIQYMNSKLEKFTYHEKEEIFEAFQDIFKEKLQCELHLQDVSAYLRGHLFSYNHAIMVAYMLHKRYLGDPFV